MTRLVVVGTGLIGGSVALAGRTRGVFDEIVGVDASAEAAQAALRRGVIDAVAGDIEACDAVCVAAPTGVLAERVSWALDRVGAGVPVFDVGSVKGPIIEAVAAARGAMAPNFVPCHPIAGSEKQGSAAARADLFEGRSVVVTPTESTAPDVLEQVERWWRAMGARVTRRDAETHDRTVALTSHLPHLAAFAFMHLVGRLDPEDVATHAGGGFRDFTRIAAADPLVWGDILTDNAARIREHLAALIDELELLARLCEEDLGALRERLAAARDLRRGLSDGDADP